MAARAKGAKLADDECVITRSFDAPLLLVPRILRHTDLVEDVPTPAADQARREARPAFRRALAARMAPFEASSHA